VFKVFRVFRVFKVLKSFKILMLRIGFIMLMVFIVFIVKCQCVLKSATTRCRSFNIMLKTVASLPIYILSLQERHCKHPCSSSEFIVYFKRKAKLSHVLTSTTYISMLKGKTKNTSRTMQKNLNPFI
jgi:hypothetical protein